MSLEDKVTLESIPNLDSCVIISNSSGMKRGDEACWFAVADMEHSLSHSFENLHLQNEYESRVKTENSIEFDEASQMESGAVTISKDNDDNDNNLEFSEIEENNVQEDNSGEIIEYKVIEPEPKCFFEERYDVFEELGKGRYGVVRKVIDKSNGIVLAAKFVRTIKAKDRQLVLEEINVMNKLKHPKLLRLLAAFESPKETIMVTEYISGGELFERVVADDFTLTEKDSILFVRQICEGVAYMHEEKVVHMDLKPENIMCQTHTSHRIKLIDFGLAQTLKPNTPVRVLFGTPEFISPEIIGFEPIGTESDMWSIGVICYVLLSGLSPFMGDSDAETFTNITRADYDFDDKAFDAISQEAMDFISSLLIKRKELRMSARDCLNHPWLAQCAENMSRVVLSTDKLKKFIVRRKWQKTGNAIRALGRMATLSANSRKNISSTSPLNSDILFEESIPEEMKNIYLLSEQSSALVAASLNSPESEDDNSELNVQPELEEILKTAMSPLAVNSLECTADSLESINYEESIIDGMKFTDDINEASSVTETKFQDRTTFDLVTQLTIPVDTVHEHVFETPERLQNSDESTIEQKQDTIEIEQPLTPLHLNTRDIHSGIDSFQDNTDSQFASDPSNIDEKEETRESKRPTTRKVSLGRIVNTGSVTRTAKMFEQENIASQSRTPVNRIVLPTADARPQNERIRKAFAFWQN